MNYSSTITLTSKKANDVHFTIARMSFSRRLELMKTIRELGQRLEFHNAGKDVRDKLDASIIGSEIDRLYLEWGLVDIDGLMVDGKPANAEMLFHCGPEDLTQEILNAIKAECGLSEEDRKN